MNFLEQIRNSSDQIKKRWLIGTSIVIMTVVIWVWLGYFNSLIMRPASSADDKEGKFSVWDGIRGSGGALWDRMTASVKDIGNKIGGSKEYIVKPQQ